MKVIVVGDHPVLKFTIEAFNDETLAKEYAGQLIHAGYEDVEIKPLGKKQIECLRGNFGTNSKK
jgi:hypothetical protein